MKVYILRGAASSYVFTEVLETKDFYLVPQKDGGFDIFAKAAFELSVDDANEISTSQVGFTPKAKLF